jgi:hypothetical protein
MTEMAPHWFPIADRPRKESQWEPRRSRCTFRTSTSSEIPAGRAYQLSIRHPDGSTQQLDISEKNYRALKLQSVGKTLKKRGRKPGPTTGAAGAPRKRRQRQNSKRPATA